MQIFWAFLPLFAFFASFRFAGIYFATGVLIVTALAQLIVHRWRTGKYQTLHLLVAGLAVVLGGATLLLHDQRFIQWKATVLFWILAVAFLGSQFVGARTLVERLFQTTTDLRFNLERRHWRNLNLAWVAFYALLGALNLYVAHHFRLDIWVNFKFYGLTALMFIFILPQAVWIASRAKPGIPDRLDLIRRALAALTPVDLDVVDESHLHAGHAGAKTGRGHFRLRIVSTHFAGLGSLARHRAVYSALGDLMQTDIHALSLETLTPAEAARPSADTHFTARGSHEH